MADRRDREPAAPVPQADVAAPVTALLDELARAVEEGRSLPMSASCVVNRGELLGLVEDLRRALPEVVARASQVLDEREGVVEQGRTEADRLRQQAQAERRTMLTKAEVHKAAQAEASRLLQEAEAEAEAMRREVEEYVDSKLANFEVVLSKTLGAVQRGRARLHGESELDALADDADDDGSDLLARS